MNSHTTEQFRKLISKLPEEIREQAKDAYRRFQENPFHPSLHFKIVLASKSISSIRVGINYWPFGIVKDEDILWFWIGSHSAYDHILSQMRK